MISAMRSWWEREALLIVWTFVSSWEGIMASFVGELSMRIRLPGWVSLAAIRTERPTAPAPKMAMLEPGGGRAMLLAGTGVS